MAEKKQMVVYAAAYGSAEAALADLDAVEQLHKDEMIGQYDAAVIDKEDGKPHVVKRMDRPHIRVIPEWFGGGTLPRKELHEAAEQLTADQAGLIAVGEPTIEEAPRQGADQGRQGRQAHGGGHDRRTRRRAAGSAQELTVPQWPGVASAWAAQHRYAFLPPMPSGMSSPVAAVRIGSGRTSAVDAGWEISGTSRPGPHQMVAWAG